MNKLKAAIIGTGLIAKLKHIPAFKQHRHKIDLAAVCDVNLEGAQKVAAEHGIPHAYADVAEMLAKEKPDLVDICTPPKTHAKLAIQVMQAGSHVLIEKPMAQTVEECDAIVNAARENKVKVCVGHSDLFSLMRKGSRSMDWRARMDRPRSHRRKSRHPHRCLRRLQRPQTLRDLPG